MNRSLSRVSSWNAFGTSLDDAAYCLIECEGGVGLLEVNRHAGAKRAVSYMPDHVKTREDLIRLVNGYDATIRYTDDHIRQVLEVVREARLPVRLKRRRAGQA